METTKMNKSREDWFQRYVIDSSQAACDKLTAAGVKFTRHPDWVAYVILDASFADVTCRAEDAALLIKDAQEELAERKESDLTSELSQIVTETLPRIELCSSAEWLEVFSRFGGGDEDEHGRRVKWDEVDKAVDDLKGKFEDAIFDYPRGQRYSCHGWNGAHFTHRNSVAGTFDVLTDAGLEKFMTI